MKKTLVISITALIIVCLFFAFKKSNKTEWALSKSHGKLDFSVSRLMASGVEGWLKNYVTTIATKNGKFIDGVVIMTARSGSINTDNDIHNRDIKSKIYFSVVKYPANRFKSRTFEKTDQENYQAAGDVTILGISKMTELNTRCKIGTNTMTKKTCSWI